LATSFHVFLSHSSADKPAVEELARRLAKEGIQAWLDKWNLIPGDPWQPAIEKALAASETCAVFVGPSGLGPWQNEEMRAAIDQRVRESARSFRVIPVLLPGAQRAERSSLPTFLAATTWVEFRDSLDDQDAFHRLVWGIRGVTPWPGRYAPPAAPARPPHTGQIFVSYRRDTSAMSAGRLYDRLSSHFASNQIFMDVDTIEPGVDFVRTIEEAVTACDVLIAVIGGHWLTSSDEKRRRRLDNPEDFVRIEIATALKRGIRVIPVLVEGASMPRSRDLPNDLKPLVRRQALEVSHNRFRADAERLIGAVERALESARAEQHREREGKQCLEHEPQSPPPNPVALSTSSGKRRLRPVAVIMTLLALVISLAVGIAIYYGFQRPSPKPTAANPSLKPTTPEVAGHPSTAPTTPVAVVTTSPTIFEVTTLEIVHYFAMQGNQEALDEMKNDFEAANPDVKIRFTYVPYSELLGRTLRMASVHKPPAISAIDNQDVLRAAKAGILKDISTEVTGLQVWNDMYPGPKAPVTSDSKVYGMPIGSNCLALYYNKKMLADAGVSSPPQTWEQLTEAATKMTKSRSYGIALSAVNTDEATAWQWEPFLWSNGGSLTDLDSINAHAALQLWVDWLEKGVASRDVVNWNQGQVIDQFNSGRAAMMVMGPWALAGLNASGVDFGIVNIPVPKVGGKPVVPLGGEVWCVLKGEPKVEEAATKFIQFTQDPERIRNICDMFNNISSIRSVAKKQGAANPKLQPFVDQMDTARPGSQDGGAKYSEISLAARAAIHRALVGQASAEEALRDAAGEIKAILGTK